MKSYSGEVAVITGAGSGIGRELALQLARHGAQLALSDKDPTSLAETATQCLPTAARVEATVVDVTDRAAIYSWADNTQEQFGKVNLVFNNAGVALGCTAEGMRDEDLSWVMDVNFWGTVHGSRAFLPHLRASGDGRLVNVSSAFGLAAMPAQSGYNASKFAIRGFTESLSLELELARAPVIVTCVFPGGIKSNIARSARIRDDLQGLMRMDSSEAVVQFEKRLITSCEAAARKILDGVSRRRRRIVIGPDAQALDLLCRWSPRLYRSVILSIFNRQAKGRRANGPASTPERPVGR